MDTYVDPTCGFNEIFHAGKCCYNDIKYVHLAVVLLEDSTWQIFTIILT